jgi:glycosyltransferase involved in cell wall biosynthesis
MLAKRPSRVRCLILTPATRFGSWSWLEKVIAASDPDIGWVVVSYGRPLTPPKEMRFISLPAVDYARAGLKMSRRPWWFMNVIYYLPLGLLAWVAWVFTRPTVLVANGIMAAIILRPLKMRKGRLVLVYHGYTGHVGRHIRRILQILLSGCDAATANSPTSVEDLSRVLDSRKITLVPHCADDLFFAIPLSRPSHERMVVLFVGRLEEEKFAQCLRVCRALALEGALELWVVGEGSLVGQIANAPGCKWFGYVSERAQLADIYSKTDIVWAPADVDYLSLPGVEALASGCPIIVSNLPAVWPKAKAGMRIPRDLIPADVGRVVDGENDDEAVAYVRSLGRGGIPATMREACRHYAEARHGPEAIRQVTQLLFQ